MLITNWAVNLDTEYKITSLLDNIHQMAIEFYLFAQILTHSFYVYQDLLGRQGMCGLFT